MFEIITAPGEVNAWSEVRLPFEPKGEMFQFRQQLGAAIKAMPPTCDGQLVATYTAADPSALIDTENVLFYNVGLGCFSAHSRRGLAFERVFAAPPDQPVATSWTARHHHRYRATPAPTDFEHWRSVHLVAQWRDVPLATGALTHPETVWAALSQVETPERPEAPVKYYALRIRIEGVQVALATIVKPLVDWVVSSLHSFAGELPDLVVERLSRAKTMDRGDVRRRLREERRAMLGPRRQLIRLTTNRIAWNPRDDDCVACVTEVASGAQPRMTGTVHSVVPRDSAG